MYIYIYTRSVLKKEERKRGREYSKLLGSMVSKGGRENGHVGYLRDPHFGRGVRGTHPLHQLASRFSAVVVGVKGVFGGVRLGGAIKILSNFYAR